MRAPKPAAKPARKPTRARCALLWLGWAACLGSAQAAGTVVLDWIEPASYTDAGRHVIDREHTLQSLGQHIQALGKHLPDGQLLRLEVLDLDLAGDVGRWHGWGLDEVRVLGGMADWPKMKLRYTLQSAGQTLASGEASLSDIGYLFRPRAGALAYEKRMLDAWFKRSFAAQAAMR